MAKKTAVSFHAQTKKRPPGTLPSFRARKQNNFFLRTAPVFLNVKEPSHPFLPRHETCIGSVKFFMIGWGNSGGEKLVYKSGSNKFNCGRCLELLGQYANSCLVVCRPPSDIYHLPTSPLDFISFKEFTSVIYKVLLDAPALPGPSQQFSMEKLLSELMNRKHAIRNRLRLSLCP